MQTDINMSAMDIRFFVVRFRARAFKMFVNYLEGYEKIHYFDDNVSLGFFKIKLIIFFIKAMHLF